MSVRLSRQKATRILKYYFKGLTQPVIARRVGVDQSTVSLYASRFSERASVVGLLEAGKEFNMSEELSELRCLSVELLKGNLTVEDARQGVKIINAFEKLGVDPDQHTGLIEVCNKVNAPGFIDAALKLNEIEANAQMNYEEAVSKFERITTELPLLEKKQNELKIEVESLIMISTEKNQEKTALESKLVQLKEETSSMKAGFEKELDAERRRLKVSEQDVKEVAKLKSETAKRGLNISTLIKIAEEFPK